MENTNNSKDVGNAISDSSNVANRGINAILKSGEEFNNWYANKINEITEVEGTDDRLETNINSSTDEELKIETKVDEYTKIQTNITNESNSVQSDTKIQTQIKKADNQVANGNEDIADNPKIETKVPKKQDKISSKVATSIKGAKFLNNTVNRAVKTGKTLNTAMESRTGSYKSFENTANKTFLKPVKKVTNKITKPIQKKVTQTTTNILTKVMKLLMKLIVEAVKKIIALLPQIAPVIIILIAMMSFISFFGSNMSDETKNSYEEYMISTQNEYDKITVEYFQNGNVVEGAIGGRGMINWRASMSIMQMLNAELVYDNAEKTLLNKFKDANLFEKIEDITYTYEKELDETDSNSNKKKETVTETKKVVKNASLDDYINWCNSNFSVINDYKKAKNLKYDSNQKTFTESEIEEIKLLYKSTAFFDLFSDRFKETYAYGSVIIDDEKLQAIYDEFLKNAGKRYLMDHSNLTYDECMEYYDCSSLVLHILGHTGIAKFPNCRSNWTIYSTLQSNTSRC